MLTQCHSVTTPRSNTVKRVRGCVIVNEQSKLPNCYLGPGVQAQACGDLTSAVKEEGPQHSAKLPTYKGNVTEEGSPLGEAKGPRKYSDTLVPTPHPLNPSSSASSSVSSCYSNLSSLGTGTQIEEDTFQCFSVLDETKSALKGLTSGDKLSQVTSWVHTSHWFTNTCRRIKPAMLPTGMVVQCLSNFRSPVVEATLAGSKAYFTVDTGCSRTLITSAYATQIFSNNYKKLLTPQDIPFRDAQGNKMNIEGRLSGVSLTLGNTTIYPSVIVYTAKHCEALLGWDLVVTQRWAIDQEGVWFKDNAPHRQGLPAAQTMYGPVTPGDTQGVTPGVSGGHWQQDQFGQSTTTGVNNNVKEVDVNVVVDPPSTIHHLPVRQPPIPVMACNHYQIAPRMAEFIQVTVESTLWKTKKNELLSQMLVFSSEEVEDHLPLDKLSIYFQLLELNHSGQAKLLYQNQENKTVFISPRDIVAHAEHMLAAGNQEMEQCAQVDPAAFIVYRVLTPGPMLAPGEERDQQSVVQPDLSRFEFGIPSVPSDPGDSQDVNCASTDKKDREFIVNLVKKHNKLFSSHTWSIGQMGSEFSLHLQSNIVPQQQKLIPIPHKLRDQAFAIIQTLLNNGLIVESTSPWLSNCLFLQKKPAEKPTKAGQKLAGDHEEKGNEDVIPLSAVRFVLDFRAVNSSLARTWTSFVIPDIKDILNTVQGNKYVSSIDVSQSFWSIPLRKGLSQNLTSFCAFGTQWMCTRLAQGLAPASQVFSRVLHRILTKHGLTGDKKKLCIPPHPRCSMPPESTTPKTGRSQDQKFTSSPGHRNTGSYHGQDGSTGHEDADQSAVVNYIDNIIISSPTREAHYKTLTKLFQVLESAGIKLKKSKSHFFISESINLFGYEVSVRKGTICPEKKKLEAISKLEAPKTRRNLKKILGIINYFSDLLPGVSGYLAPLYAMTSDQIPFKFTPECTQAFEKAKRELQKVPICYLMDLSKPCYAFSDCAQGNSTSYVLFQWHKGLHRLVPCRFQSHTMTKFQRQYSQAQGEALGITLLISEQLPVLMYSNNYLFTDAKSLTFISKFKYTNVQVFRWSQLLHSISLSLIWLPATSFFLELTDIFTRPSQPNAMKKINQKITMSKIADLQYLNFHGLPSLSLQQCTQILDAFHLLMERLSPSEVQAKLYKTYEKHQFSPCPNLSHQVPGHDKARPVFSLYTEGKRSSISSKPLTLYCRAIQKRPRWFTDLEDKFHVFFPDMSLQNLVSYQTEDSFIQNQLKNKPDVYVIVKGVVCKRSVTKGDETCQVMWPQVLNIPLLEKAHVVGASYHLGKDKLHTSLKSSFYVRNFVQDFFKMVNECRFCLLNQKHKIYPVPQGISFSVCRPRQWIAYDVCTLNHSWSRGSFLLIVDVVSMFVVCCQCQNSPTAEEIYQLVLTNWIGVFGMFLASTKDNAKCMTNTLEAELHALFNSRSFHITPYQSSGNGVAEKCNDFITCILKSVYQNHVVTEQNLQICLSFAALLWNSTPSTKTGVSPAHLQLGGQVRTHNMVSFTSLKNAENKHVLIRELSIVKEILFQVVNKRKQAQLLKEGKLQAYKDTLHPGDFCLILKKSLNTRILHKLRPKYFDDVFRIVKVRNTYVLAFKWNDKMSLKSRLKGMGEVTHKQYYRFQKVRVKKLLDPLKYLGITLNDSQLKKAAGILGEAEAVSHVTLDPPPAPPPPHRRTLIQQGGLWEPFLPGGLYHATCKDLQAKLVMNTQMLKKAKDWMQQSGNVGLTPSRSPAPHSGPASSIGGEAALLASSKQVCASRRSGAPEVSCAYTATHLVSLKSGVSMSPLSEDQMASPTCTYGDTLIAKQHFAEARLHRQLYLRDVASSNMQKNHSTVPDLNHELKFQKKKRILIKIPANDIARSLIGLFMTSPTDSPSSSYVTSSAGPSLSTVWDTPDGSTSERGPTSIASNDHHRPVQDGSVTSTSSNDISPAEEGTRERSTSPIVIRELDNIDVGVIEVDTSINDDTPIIHSDENTDDDIHSDNYTDISEHDDDEDPEITIQETTTKTQSVPASVLRQHVSSPTHPYPGRSPRSTKQPTAISSISRYGRKKTISALYKK